MQSFELKIPPPVAFLLIDALMWLAARLTPLVTLDDSVRMGVTAAFTALGLGLGLGGVVGFSRAKTTPSPVKIEEASALVTGGVYRLSRNPMYLGLACLLLGSAVFLAAPWTLLGPVAFVAFITRFQIVPEERVLAAKFGRAYTEYCERIRRWV